MKFYDHETSDRIRRNLTNIVKFNSLTFNYVLKEAGLSVRTYNQSRCQGGKLKVESVQKLANALGIPESRLIGKLDIENSSEREIIKWIDCYEF